MATNLKNSIKIPFFSKGKKGLGRSSSQELEEGRRNVQHLLVLGNSVTYLKKPVDYFLSSPQLFFQLFSPFFLIGISDIVGHRGLVNFFFLKPHVHQQFLLSFCQVHHVDLDFDHCPPQNGDQLLKPLLVC